MLVKNGNQCIELIAEKGSLRLEITDLKSRRYLTIKDTDSVVEMLGAMIQVGERVRET